MTATFPKEFDKKCNLHNMPLLLFLIYSVVLFMLNTQYDEEMHSKLFVNELKKDKHDLISCNRVYIRVFLSMKSFINTILTSFVCCLKAIQKQRISFI